MEKNRSDRWLPSLASNREAVHRIKASWGWSRVVMLAPCTTRQLSETFLVPDTLLCLSNHSWIARPLTPKSPKDIYFCFYLHLFNVIKFFFFDSWGFIM